MEALLLYLASHWVLVIAATLGVVALGGAAYVFKNLKFALAAIVLAFCGFMYQGVVMHGINIQIEADRAKQVALLAGRIKVLNDIETTHTQKALEDAAKIEELESKANETPVNTGACLDIDAASRVRAIGTERKPATTGTGRHSNLFSKGSRQRSSESIEHR